MDSYDIAMHVKVTVNKEPPRELILGSGSRARCDNLQTNLKINHPGFDARNSCHHKYNLAKFTLIINP